MNWNAIDWRALERLRAVFLEGKAGATDYWRDERDLESYNETFAQRIGWKWDYVLNELKRRGWSPTSGVALDWGCGSGIAGRAFLEYFASPSITSLAVWDRSPLAMQFTARRAHERFPGVGVHRGIPPGEIGTLLLSHVLTELNEKQTDDLLTFATQATAVIWVEPGTHDVSRALIAVREKLRGKFHVVAPCTHQAACGMLAPGNERHWCHHFAPSPPQVFTDGDWARFANFAGVDLRSLPLSFLALDKRPQPMLPDGATRVVGEPRIYKAHALVLGCDASGVRERRLTKRALPEEFRRIKKGESDALQVWKCDGDEISSAKPLF
jgi:hypothetical protein